MKYMEKGIKVSEAVDVARAVIEARRLAETAGFRENEQYMVATAVSELATNIILYAVRGEVTIRVLDGNARKGIEIVAKDDGPGIEDIGRAMDDQFSTGGGLGMGLPGVKRLMNEFTIDSKRGSGTTVTAKRWV